MDPWPIEDAEGRTYWILQAVREMDRKAASERCAEVKPITVGYEHIVECLAALTERIEKLENPYPEVIAALQKAADGQATAERRLLHTVVERIEKLEERIAQPQTYKLLSLADLHDVVNTLAEDVKELQESGRMQDDLAARMTGNEMQEDLRRLQADFKRQMDAANDKLAQDELPQERRA